VDTGHPGNAAHQDCPPEPFVRMVRQPAGYRCDRIHRWPICGALDGRRRQARDEEQGEEGSRCGP